MIDHSKLDLTFVLDTTSSMHRYIHQAKENIEKIANELRRMEKCHLRVGLVNYRDHPPEDHTYVTKVYDLSEDIGATKAFLNETMALGGGDNPEAICCALHGCLEDIKWREDAVKVAILICDAPPHGLDNTVGYRADGFPQGCPEKKDPVEIAHKMAQKGITLYTAGCEPSLKCYRKFFMALSLITGGKYVALTDAEKLASVIIGGAREDISMEKLMAQAHNEYMKEVAEKGGMVDEDELTKRIHKVLNSSSEAKINSIESSTELKITDDIKELAKQTTLKDLVGFARLNNIDITEDRSLPTIFPAIPTIGVCIRKPVLGKIPRVVKAVRKVATKTTRRRKINRRKRITVTLTMMTRSMTKNRPILRKRLAKLDYY